MEDWETMARFVIDDTESSRLHQDSRIRTVSGICLRDFWSGLLHPDPNLT